MPREQTPRELLATPVQFVKGVGPDRAPLLQKLGLYRASDLLFHFPRAYQDLSELRRIDQLVEDYPVSVCGEVVEVEMKNTGVGRTLLGVLFRQGNDFARAIWFNMPYLRKNFSPGQRILVAGPPKLRGLRWEFTHPRVEMLGDKESPPAGQVLPIYSLTDGINQAAMRRLIQDTVAQYGPLVEESLPCDFLDEHDLWPITAALTQIHEPANQASLEQARRRFIYQELLVLQLALALRRQRIIAAGHATAMPTNATLDARILKLFQVEPTADQRQAMAEVASDLGRSTPMNRLLQGDVGTGKTLVAMYAMLLAVAHHRQAALMAPTEVLARQHARTLEKSLEGSRVRIGVLAGSLGLGARRRLLEKISAGEIDLIIGTHAVVHAILRAQTQFSRLGLVVIDEQHKFGVRQRAALKQAGIDPHYLVMTATPIPRTVSMTLFGDLDVSVLRKPPPGRQPVHSYLAGEDRYERWWDFFRKKLREGRQGYVIAPLVEEQDQDAAEADQAFPDEASAADRGLQLVNGSNQDYLAASGAGETGYVERVLTSDESLLDPQAAELLMEEDTDEQAVPAKPPIASVASMYEELVHGPLADFRLELLHGRMTSEEKEAVMERFRQGDVQVLVATSVIEVGVDVPNASVMTIQSGERFGLAQLHQLRGRIGRGKYPGYLCVFAQPKSDESQARLDAFVSTTDGFELAELDFQLRGPGDLFGTRQHGLPPLRIADLQRDGAILLAARDAAQKLIANRALWDSESCARLRRQVVQRYGESLDLGDVG
jgi:ATP-dependent DNA helicase RecG